MAGKKKVAVTLIKSTIGCTERQIACVSGLGLAKLQQTRQLLDTPEVRGMIRKVEFLLRVEEV